MILGAFGELIFEVSTFKVQTFGDFKRETKAKFAEHELILNPAKLEFLHRELETISFSMTFHAALGTDPQNEINRLREMCKTGEANFLIIGNHAYGENEWVVESISEDAIHWRGDKILVAKVNVSLKEYR